VFKCRLGFVFAAGLEALSGFLSLTPSLNSLVAPLKKLSLVFSMCSFTFSGISATILSLNLLTFSCIDPVCGSFIAVSTTLLSFSFNAFLSKNNPDTFFVAALTFFGVTVGLSETEGLFSLEGGIGILGLIFVLSEVFALGKAGDLLENIFTTL